MNLPKSIRYLAVEGVIGVGKSTLVKYLSEHMACQPLFEEFETNPFLSEFYRDRKKFAFQTQIFFLLSRYRQILETFHQQDLFSPVRISDYMFNKDKIFASLNLDENEMALYSKLSALVERELTKPDYIIYLQANTDILLDRIRMRDRAYERNVDPKYIEALNECYNSYFMHYADSPLMIVNTNDIDFVRNPDDLQLLLEHICKAPRGVTYFSPMHG